MIGSTIADFFTKTIPGWWDGFVAWLTSLPAKIGSLMTSLANTVLESIGVAIGLAIAAIVKGPDLVWEKNHHLREECCRLLLRPA